jgi:hypothetical protein
VVTFGSVKYKRNFPWVNSDSRLSELTSLSILG